MKPEIRNSLPPPLASMQGWMESERLLQRLLPMGDSTELKILRIRRNFKFRKLIVESGDRRFICYTHYWPRGLRNLAAFTRQARDAGIVVPQPIQQATGWSAVIEQKCFSLVLPFMPGQAIGNQADSGQITALGNILGQLHGIRSAHWGPLMTNFGAHGHYWYGLHRYWRRAQRQLAKYGNFANRQDISTVLAWLHESGQFLQDMQLFSLTHGDPASGNFLAQPNGELCMIDCDRINHEPGPMELANALLQAYCRNDTGRRIQLVQAYLEKCPRDVGTSWETHAHFYLGAALLWRAQRKLQWSIKRSTAGLSAERASKSWQQLLHVIKSQPADWPSAVALLED